MLETKNLSFQYSGGGALRFPDISLSKGENRLILGNSGCGKTTFLHLIGGLLSLQKGEITINKTALSKLKSKALDQFRGQNMGFIFQQPHLIKALSVKENLFLAQYLAGKPQDLKKIIEVLELLDMASKINSKVYQLSQGQQQRIAIARAIVNSPSLLLADEPTSSLDDENCKRVIDLLKKVASVNQTSLLITTHDSRLKNEVKNHTILQAI